MSRADLIVWILFSMATITYFEFVYVRKTVKEVFIAWMVRSYNGEKFLVKETFRTIELAKAGVVRDSSSYYGRGDKIIRVDEAGDGRWIVYTNGLGPDGYYEIRRTKFVG